MRFEFINGKLDLGWGEFGGDDLYLLCDGFCEIDRVAPDYFILLVVALAVDHEGGWLYFS